MKCTTFPGSVKNWKRQAKLIVGKSALTTEALKEGVIGREGNIIQGKRHRILALGQLFFAVFQLHALDKNS